MKAYVRAGSEEPIVVRSDEIVCGCGHDESMHTRTDPGYPCIVTDSEGPCLCHGFRPTIINRCKHGKRIGLPPCTACSDEEILEELVFNARCEFGDTTENGDWPEKWDSQEGVKFLARYLMSHVIVTRAR